MKQNWQYKPLEEISQINYGTRVVQKKDQGTKYDVYGGGGKTFKVDKFNRENCFIISRFAMSPTCTRFVSGKFFLNDSGLSVKVINEILLQIFLDKYLEAKNDFIYSLGKGAAQRNLDMQSFRKMIVPIPPLSEQERIVAELDLLSGIIEKQKQQLKELDTLAQSIFYSMFGDPVTNEKNWEIKCIENLCKSIIRGPFGSALKKEFFIEPSDIAYKVYEQKNAIQKDASIGTYYIDEERFKSLKRFEIKSGDIIMSCSGTIGEFYEIPIDAKKGVMNQALLKFTLDYNQINKSFFLFIMDFVKESFDKKGSGLQNIGSVVTIKNMKISVPSISLQNEFAEKIENIEKQKEAINKSIEETQKLFDYTMDKYFG